MQTIYMHPDNPQPRMISQLANAIQQDQLVVYPTDTGYQFACKIDSKEALRKLKLIRQLDDTHQFTILCHDISTVSSYADVSNTAYKVLKNKPSEPTCFILLASKEVPKKLLHAKSKTIGIRLVNDQISQLLLQELATPLLISSIVLPHHDTALNDPFDIEDALQNNIDILANVGEQASLVASVIDLSEE